MASSSSYLELYTLHNDDQECKAKTPEHLGKFQQQGKFLMSKRKLQEKMSMIFTRKLETASWRSVIDST